MINKLWQIMNKMNDIKYGYVAKGKNIYPETDEEWDNDIAKKYRLQSPEELLKNKYGTCWDQVELERYLLDQENISCNSYFIVEYDNKIFPTHTFIVVKGENNYYWFEHSWESYRGIHEYDSLESLLIDVKAKFCQNSSEENTIIYLYEKPKSNITGNEFFDHCERGQKINI